MRPVLSTGTQSRRRPYTDGRARPAGHGAACVREFRTHACRWSVPVAVEDPASGQVVRAELHEYAVVREDLDVVLADLSADVREHVVAVLQLHLEGGVA